MRVLVTGGCGYKGSVLVPRLIDEGHRVTVLDTQWFGNALHQETGLDFCHDDLRSLPGSGFTREHLREYDAVIHLAGIANDPCGDLDAKLTWEVNALATMRLADACARAGVKQFIFASSASVYGVKDNVPVTEDMEPEPVSDYNKTKMVAERCLLSYSDRMAVQIVRPATVCGLSPRMRFDTMVNMLTAQALGNGKITAHCGDHGGQLMRPNIHIEDIADVYLFMLARPHLTGCWNAGFENISAMDTAKMIAERTGAGIEITTVKDKRSYAVDSSKLIAAGFAPKRSVATAINDIVAAWEKGVRPDERSVNLEWMRKLGVVG